MDPASTSEAPKAAAARQRAWGYLLLASVFEIVFALATNASEGFTRLGPSLLVVVAASAGIFFLSTALRHLDVGVGYTVWVGIGSVGTVLLGSVIFEERLSAPKLACFALIIAGIVALKMTENTPSSRNGDKQRGPTES